MTDKLVILDRDGVINHDSDNYIKSPDEWIPIDGSLEAIARLKKAGYKVAVATNQSGIARGYYSVETLHAMHDKLRKLLGEYDVELDDIQFCPHGPDDGCHCRKPNPGMLEAISDKLNIPLAGVPFVGDTLGDLNTAIAAGARPVLVLTGKGERTIQKLEEGHGFPVFDQLSDVVETLLSEENN